MSLFYFDIQNGHAYTDDIGSEHADIASVRNEVRHVLAETAAGNTSKDAFQIQLGVRDEYGKRVVTASLMMILEVAH